MCQILKKTWIVGELSKLSRFEYFELNIPSDRVFQKMTNWQTELKLWPLEV